MNGLLLLTTYCDIKLDYDAILDSNARSRANQRGMKLLNPLSHGV